MGTSIQAAPKPLFDRGLRHLDDSSISAIAISGRSAFTHPPFRFFPDHGIDSSTGPSTNPIPGNGSSSGLGIGHGYRIIIPLVESHAAVLFSQIYWHFDTCLVYLPPHSPPSQHCQSTTFSGSLRILGKDQEKPDLPPNNNAIRPLCCGPRVNLSQRQHEHLHHDDRQHQSVFRPCCGRGSGRGYYDGRQPRSTATPDGIRVHSRHPTYANTPRGHH